MSAYTRPAWLLACLLLLGLAACGGGGGGGSSDSAVSSTWHFASISGSIDPDFRSSFGTWVLDGAGGATVTTTTNVDGVVGSPDSGEAGFEFGPDNTVTALLADLPLLTGYVNGDRSVAVLSTTYRGTQPNIGVMIRSSTGRTRGDMQGTWHRVTYHLDHVTGFVRSWVGSLEFDGLRGLDYNASPVVNRGGTITTGGSLRGVSYDLDPDGALELFSPTLQGGVTPDGQLFATGGESSGASPVVRKTIAVPVSTGASNTTFAGRYAFVRLAYQPFGFESRQGILASDGQGGFQLSGMTRNFERTVDATTTPTGGTYTVAPDGGLTLTTSAGGYTHVGAVSPNGRYAILGGATTERSSTTIWILIRL